MSFKLVRATVDDVVGISRLFDEYRVFYGKESDISLAEEFITERLVNNQSVVFCAIDSDGDYLGFCQLYPTFSSVSAQSSWILNDLYVNHRFRRQSVAKSLMNAAREHAIQTGAKGLGLQTAHDNFNAQALYQSLGYKKDQQFYSYYLAL